MNLPSYTEPQSILRRYFVTSGLNPYKQQREEPKTMSALAYVYNYEEDGVKMDFAFPAYKLGFVFIDAEDVFSDSMVLLKSEGWMVFFLPGKTPEPKIKVIARSMVWVKSQTQRKGISRFSRNARCEWLHPKLEEYIVRTHPIHELDRALTMLRRANADG